MLAVCANLFVSVAQAQAAEQVINLVEIALPSPLDDLEGNNGDPEVPIRRFQATISGHTLQVVANTGMIARMQVENNTTGEVVEDKSFTATAVTSLPQVVTPYIFSPATLWSQANLKWNNFNLLLYYEKTIIGYRSCYVYSK